jgi:hypothetical protein
MNDYGKNLAVIAISPLPFFLNNNILEVRQQTNENNQDPTHQLPKKYFPFL